MSAVPRLTKGAIVQVDPANPLAGICVFQYNPETVQRTLEPRDPASAGAGNDSQRLSGPPRESVELTIVLDATDALEAGEGDGMSPGVHAQLAVLEMMLYPKSAMTLANLALSAVGLVEILPPTAPLTLFIWGPRRVVPVRLSRMSITEEIFDEALNPIRARVNLSFEVMSYADFRWSNAGAWVSLAHQSMKEGMATRAGLAPATLAYNTVRSPVTNAANAVGSGVAAGAGAVRSAGSSALGAVGRKLT